jgi:hypothetical protein
MWVSRMFVSRDSLSMQFFQNVDGADVVLIIVAHALTSRDVGDRNLL